MIEVYDIKDAEPKKLDITPELAIAAYNTLIQFCRQQEISEDGICSRCILYNNCPAITDSVPEDWEEIHYPRMTSNTTIEYESIILNHGFAIILSSTSICNATPRTFEVDASRFAKRLIFTKYVPLGNV